MWDIELCETCATYLVREMRGTLRRVQRIIVWTFDILDINGMCHIPVNSPTITPVNIAIRVWDTKWWKLVMLAVSCCTSFHEFDCSYMNYLKVQDIILLCVIVKQHGVVFLVSSNHFNMFPMCTEMHCFFVPGVFSMYLFYYITTRYMNKNILNWFCFHFATYRCIIHSYMLSTIVFFRHKLNISRTCLWTT